MSDPDPSRERLVDAALASAVLVATVATGLWVGASPDPPAALVGGAGTLAFEAVASRDAERVRTAWRQQWVRATAIGVAALVVGGGAVLAPDPTVSGVTGALLTYLTLLVLVAVGVVPPPAEWTGRR